MLVSVVAGSGLTAAGLGPLAGGALAEESTATTEGSTGTTTTTTSEETTTGTTPTKPAPPTTTSTPVPSTPAPSPTTTSTPSTPTKTSEEAEVDAPAPPTATNPSVVLQRRQKTTASKKAESQTSATLPSATQGAANNVAVAPQIVAAQAGALAAELAGSAASTQALAFYRIPLFLLPIYQAAAVQYGVPWQILAAINEIETNYGTDQSVSTAGAVGWMQFMPATWIQYGVDALNSGYADPYNPVDAIFAAARYLRAAGAASDLHGAILAYNHSEEYVSSVLLRAKLISSYPKGVIAALTGLSDGRLPVSGKRVAWGSISTVPAASATGAVAPVASQGAKSTATPGSAAAPAPSAAAAAAAAGKHAKAAPPVQLVDLMSAPNAAAVAVQDGRIVKLGKSSKLGKYVILRDVYGDVFTYAGLGSIATHYHKAKAPHSVAAPASTTPAAKSKGAAPKPKLPATAGRQLPVTLKVKAPKAAKKPATTSVSVASAAGEPDAPATGKVRLFAHPGNPDALTAAASSRKAHARTVAAGHLLPLRVGAIVSKGTTLGIVRTPANAHAGHLRFAVRPGGDANTIDPRAILQNWAQLDAALHPQGASVNSDLLGATAGGVFLLSQAELQRTVLSDPGISIYECGRQDIAAGAIDKRVLAVLAFLSRSGLKPTVSALECGHSELTTSGNVSEHYTGDAVDISAINGTPIVDHQGAGTITDITIRTLLTLQGEFVPHQIISLMSYPGAANTLAMPDHWNHIHVGFRPTAGEVPLTPGAAATAAHSAGAGKTAPAPVVVTEQLDTTQWNQLITHIAALPAPKVSVKKSSAAIKDAKQP